MRIKRIWAPIIAGLLLLTLILPQLALADPGDSISLSSSSGHCGDLIEVTASVEAAGTYRICWVSRTPDNVHKTKFTVYAAGNYTVEFIVPETAKGTYIIYLTSEDYSELDNAEFVVFPSVQIDSTKGPVGTAVTLSGYGFTASQNIRVKFKDTVIVTTPTNSLGSWKMSPYTIPATPAGSYTFEVEFEVSGVWYDLVGKNFKVTPKITAPSSGTVGHTIEVKGTGFYSKEKDIEVTFDGEVVEPNSPIEVNENGSWSATIAVPPLPRGDHIIDASGKLTRARDVDGVTFTVGAGVLVEPTSAHVGDTITVKGGGFAAGETGITVTFGGQFVTPTITARSDGSWEESFVLPPSPYGANTVIARGDVTPDKEATLTVKARIESLSLNEGAPGDTVTLTGSGFGSSKTLRVTISGVAATENLPSQYNGDVAISFRVPKGVTTGKQTLKVDDGAGAIDEVDFTVTTKTLSTIPLPISPKDSTLRSGKVTFRWQGVTGGTGYTYTLEINTSAGPGNIWSKPDIKGSSYTLTDTETVTETLKPGTYYWRVKIVDDYGNQGDWSDSVKFKVSPIPSWVWVVVGLVVLVGLMVVAYRETKFKVTE